MLYTDGLTDAYAPDRTLDAEDVASMLASCTGRSASEIADRIQHAALDDDMKQPRDDVALVVVRLTQEAADQPVAQPAASLTGASP